MFQTDAESARTDGHLDDFVARILEERGYLFVPPVRFFPCCVMEQPIYTRQCEIGKDIYGKRRRVDIILYHPKLWPDCLIVQSKWQKSRGSVEEKFPFEVLSIAQGHHDAIILLDGGGYSAGAKRWLCDQSGGNRLLHVFDRIEFTHFTMNGGI